jgi:proteic killer suppression protein
MVTLDVTKVTRYVTVMIKTFRDRETELVAARCFSKRLPRDIQRKAKMKLDLIEAAADLEDLRVPPGNRLEALKGTRAGQHSIRINDQWRICFRWEEGAAWDVEIIDYH